MDQTVLRQEAMRLVDARARLLSHKPFYGRLLMRLSFGFENCGTAYTDMEKIVFDPEFAHKLSDSELEFVLSHELLHCVLKHCTRAVGKLPRLYNIACDIVINSVLLEESDLTELIVNGHEVMHRTPKGDEGRLYTADEVYKQLLEKTDEQIINLYGEGLLDSHDEWDKLETDDIIDSAWDGYIRDSLEKAQASAGSLGVLIRRERGNVMIKSKVDWRTILHNFIQYDRSDYLFSVPDRRYSSDIILPSFCENVYGSKVDNIWFALDTSGSVTRIGLEQALFEVKMAIEQIGNLTGKLFFFDTELSDPTPFDDVKTLDEIIPVGGGGTCFEVIFDKLKEAEENDELPVAIVVATDGYAPFPEEKYAMEIPVVWVIIDSDVEPPWGTVVQFDTE